MIERRRQTDATPPLRMWGEPAASSYQLRSGSYMTTSIKRPSGPSLFELFACEVYACDVPEDRYNVINRPDHWLNQRKRGEDGFVFVLNVIIPSAANLIMLAYFREPSPGAVTKGDSAAARLFCAWCDGTDAFRNERFKLIPRVAKGPLLIRRGVGAKPVLLGKRITVLYHRQPGAFEVDIDVSSDRFADRITRMVRDAMASSVCLDLAVTLEGREAAELPEAILGAVRCDHLDFAACNHRLPPAASLKAAATLKVLTAQL